MRDWLMQDGHLCMHQYANTAWQAAHDVHVLYVEQGDGVPTGTLASRRRWKQSV